MSSYMIGRVGPDKDSQNPAHLVIWPIPGPNLANGPNSWPKSNPLAIYMPFVLNTLEQAFMQDQAQSI